MKKGFTLIEIMIATTIFAVFVTAYMVNEGSNLSDSYQMRRVLVLKKLCNIKINQIFTKPPEFEESLTLSAQTGTFEEEGYADYEYKIEYQRLVIPDLNKIKGSEEGGGEESEGTEENPLQNKIFDVMKKNVQEMIWQVRVSVNAKGDAYYYALSSLITNHKAKVEVNIK